MDPDWTPEYESWRHGGWYVVNVRHPSGACGCVSRNYPDRKWRIVCDERDGDHTYRTRDEAAHAERALTQPKPKGDQMDPNNVHQTIAQQVDHMKPEHLTPGVDIGIEIVDERAIRVLVLPHQESYEIRLDPSDTYTVTRSVLDAQRRPIAAEQPLAGVYCDQLGEIIFGDEAKVWTQPMVQISDDDGETWRVVA